MTYISWSHLYVSLLCNRERQAAIRHAPFSSDNSCLVSTQNADKDTVDMNKVDKNVV